MDTQNYEKIYTDENKGFFLFSFQAKDINRIIPMHFHKEIEVLYCISGKMKIWVEGKIIILQPGQFFVINSLVPHSTQSYEQGEFVVFYFHSKLFLDQEARINVWEQKDKQDIYQQEIKLIQQIFASTQEEDPYIVFHQRSLLNEFIYILLKEFSTNEVLDQRTKNRNKKNQRYYPFNARKLCKPTHFRRISSFIGIYSDVSFSNDKRKYRTNILRV